MCHDEAMAKRPLSADERAYLEDYKASLDEAWRAFWLTLCLWGLPAGFLASSVAPTRAGAGDRVAIAIAGAILFALIGGVVTYSPQAGRRRRLGLADLRLPGMLEEDLLAQEADDVEVVIDAKLVKGGKKQATARRYFVKAGDRQLELNGPRWMSLAPGQSVLLSLAPRSGMVLAVEGMRERLPMLTARPAVARRADENEAESGPPTTSFEP